MRFFLVFWFIATAASADLVTPTRTLRPGTLITEADLVVKGGGQSGMFDRIADVAGLSLIHI